MKLCTAFRQQFTHFSCECHLVQLTLYLNRGFKNDRFKVLYDIISVLDETIV